LNKLGLILVAALLIALSGVVAVLHDANQLDPAYQAATQTSAAQPTRVPTLTPSPSQVPTSTPLVTLTPSNTLLPPPTLPPPTNTPLPSPTPSVTLTFTPIVAAVPGLIGLETATPESTPGCVVRKDWKLTYTVQANDSLSQIAQTYGTDSQDLAQGNCLSDRNKIYIGEVLHVPGTSQPSTPQFNCFPIQLLAPMNYTVTIPGSGTINFDWYGPITPRYLLRIFAPDGTKIEYEMDMRQNYTANLSDMPQAGTFTWYVYPLDLNFNGVCTGGGPWYFQKAAAPTATPTTARIPTEPVPAATSHPGGIKPS